MGAAYRVSSKITKIILYLRGIIVNKTTGYEKVFTAPFCVCGICLAWSDPHGKDSVG